MSNADDPEHNLAGTHFTQAIRIPAPSRCEAMDWSLVLASQEIESIIDHAETDPEWGLIIREADASAAFAALHQYRIENRHFRWQQPLPWRGVFFDWVAAGWVVLLAVFYWLSHVRNPALLDAGMTSSIAIKAGEWWRLFTAITLHADVGHLATNGTIGLVLLGLAMARLGTGIALLAAFLAGAIGNVLGLLLYPDPFLGLGASGMVMGALGLITAQGLVTSRQLVRSIGRALAAMVAGFMLFLLLGSSPDTDLVAHLGGFLGGLALGIPLSLLPAGKTQDSLLNSLAGVTLAALVILTWWLAIGGLTNH